MRSNTNWIQTYTGKQFWTTDPRPEDVCIEDVAHALSLKCRFTGHCKSFYSVAQHSLLVSLHCESDPKWGLMHDAAEAYLPDVARPVKSEIVGFVELEERLLSVIAERFGLRMPIPESVHQTDLTILATEKRDLMKSTDYEWESIKGVDPLPADLYRIRPYSDTAARYEFYKRYRELWNV